MFKAEICFTNYYHQRMHHKVLDLLILKDSSVFTIFFGSYPHILSSGIRSCEKDIWDDFSIRFQIDN